MTTQNQSARPIRRQMRQLLLGIAPVVMSAAAYAQVSSQPTATQAADTQLGEIIVTATRQSEQLSKVPISIAAYQSETMDRLGVRNIEDIARLTPGVSFTGSGSNVNISIRGIRSDFGAPTTAIYIDDTPIQASAKGYGAFGTSYPQVFDLERVEILRGPQGTLFGGSAEGGAIRFITPEPSLTKTSVYSRAEVSNVEHGGLNSEFGLAVSAPLIQDQLGIRVSAWRQRSAGFVDRQPFNLSTPDTPVYKDSNFGDTTVVRAALKYQPFDGFTVTPAVYYQRVSRNDEDAIWGSLSNFKDSRFVSGDSVQQPIDDRYTLPSLKIEGKLGFADLTSVSTYFDRKVGGVQDYTKLDATLLTYNFNRVIPTINREFAAFLPGQEAPSFNSTRQQIVTQEVRLSSPDRSARLTWTVGGFYSRARQIEDVRTQDLFVDQMIGFPIEFALGIPLEDGRYIFTTFIDSVEKQVAAFGQVDFKLTERLSLTAGLRYSDLSFRYRHVQGGPLNYNPDVGTPTQTVYGNQSAKPLTPKFSLNFQADQDNLLYASVSKGFRNGGVNEPLFAGCTTLVPPQEYKPDTTWNYEIGSKNKLFGGTVSLDQSVYLIKWNDIQEYVTPGGACAGSGFRDNLGKATSKGFDFQANARLSSRLTIGGAVGYVKATNTQTVSLNGNIAVRNGDALPVSPWQLFGNVDYILANFALPRLGDAESYVHLDARYNSHNNGRWARRDDPSAIGYDPNVDFDPATAEFNLRGGIRHDELDVSIFVNNLFDRAPQFNKYHDIADSPIYTYSTLRPRTVGLTVTFRR